MMYDESGSHSTDMMSDQCNKYNYLYPLLALTKKKKHFMAYKHNYNSG